MACLAFVFQLKGLGRTMCAIDLLWLEGILRGDCVIGGCWIATS